MKVKIKKVEKDTLDSELILLEVMENCNMNHFLILDATFGSDGKMSNLHRHVYLFDSLPVKKGDYVRLYTRKITPKDKPSFENKRGTTTYQFFWGLDEQIWNEDGDVAYLLHYDDWERLVVSPSGNEE